MGLHPQTHSLYALVGFSIAIASQQQLFLFLAWVVLPDHSSVVQGKLHPWGPGAWGCLHTWGQGTYQLITPRVTPSLYPLLSGWAQGLGSIEAHIPAWVSGSWLLIMQDISTEHSHPWKRALNFCLCCFEFPSQISCIVGVSSFSTNVGRIGHVWLCPPFWPPCCRSWAKVSHPCTGAHVCPGWGVQPPQLMQATVQPVSPAVLIVAVAPGCGKVVSRFQLWFQSPSGDFLWPFPLPSQGECSLCARSGFLPAPCPLQWFAQTHLLKVVL